MHAGVTMATGVQWDVGVGMTGDGQWGSSHNRIHKGVYVNFVDVLHETTNTGCMYLHIKQRGYVYTAIIWDYIHCWHVIQKGAYVNFVYVLHKITYTGYMYRHYR